MSKLVNECLVFIHDNLSEIVKIPIDLACISAKMVTKLVTLYTVEQLDAVQDPKDKVSRCISFYRLCDGMLHLS
jgi:hypothetical protein